jgi:glycosyltransferase involved in cell wall biosynthesis
VKVLVVHNRYGSSVPSGENRVVDTEIDMLAAAGVEVVPYLRSSDEIARMPVTHRLAVPLQPLYARRSVETVEALIRAHRPLVLHLHNPYPLVSLSVVPAAHRLGVPVVQTVHNHRHSCMRGSYFRDGHPCVLCQGRSTPWPAVQHGCYRDSRLQSIPMAAAFRLHRDDQRSVDRYIALTQPIADSLLASGLVRADQVVVRPNTVPDPGPPEPPGMGLLFVGRLTREKGVDVLLEAWQRSNRTLGTLTLVGDGPLRADVEALAADPATGIVARGPLDAEGVAAQMRRCAAVVVPSSSPEALPLVVLEAFAHGRAVLASDGGGLASTVDRAIGLLAQPGVTGLVEGLDAFAALDLVALGHAARLRYEQRYSPAVVIAAQLEIYRSVLAPASQ